MAKGNLAMAKLTLATRRRSAGFRRVDVSNFHHFKKSLDL
jgi:hypothetical protein